MTVLAAIEGVTGGALVGAVLSDVFRSVVVPRATTGRLRLGPVLGAGALRIVLAWTRRQPQQRQALLVALGPVLLVTSMLVWVALMILGYGLLPHALGAVLDAVALVPALDHHDAAEQARLCCRLGTRLTMELATQSGLRAPFAPGLTEAAFHEALGALRQDGYAARPDDWRDNGAAWTGFQALRRRYMPPLLAVRDQFGILNFTWDARPEALWSPCPKLHRWMHKGVHGVMRPADARSPADVHPARRCGGRRARQRPAFGARGRPSA